jgi:hypothetical protein
MALQVKTLVVTFFKNFGTSQPPSHANFTRWDAMLMQKYGPSLHSAMVAARLNPSDPEHGNYVIMLAELSGQLTVPAKLKSACQFFAMVLAASAATSSAPDVGLDPKDLPTAPAFDLNLANAVSLTKAPTIKSVKGTKRQKPSPK